MILHPILDEVRTSQKPLERGAFVVLEFRVFFARIMHMEQEIVNFKNITKKIIVVMAGMVILGMIAYGVLYWRKDIKPQDERQPNTQEVTQQESNDPDFKVETVGTPGSSDKKPTEPTPSLSRPVVNSAKIPDAAFLQIKQTIDSVSEKLKTNPYSFDLWVQLGVARRTIGDYKGAEEAYNYALLIRPKSFIARSNLADVVDFDYKDYPRAEKLYREMLEVYSSRLDTYRKLYELYRYRYTQKQDLADDVLLEGLKIEEDNTELLITLARYYKETGHPDLAKPYYEKLLQIIHQSGDTKLEEAIRSEM